MSLTSDDEQNWILFRERSLQPGGFGEDRVRIWPALLGAQPLSDPPPYSEVDSTNEYVDEGLNGSVADPHADERQIKLDTDRSFVLYPGEPCTAPARDALQNDLHGLLVSLFRKRRSLHYFQGFHDIMTVIFLTLPQPLHLACAEKMALHRVRDAMGVGLEPVLGLLRVLRNLLRLADPAYAKLLENISPLPYHALSNLLTLFSHDIPTLPLIQHVWDFLLSREPIAVVWLAGALILHRKPSVYLLAEQDEEGMIHSLLGGIPELVDAEPEFYDTGNNGLAQDTVIEIDRATEIETASERSIARSHSDGGGAGPHEQPSSEAIDGTLGSPDVNEQTHVSRDTSTGDEDNLNRSSIPSDVVQNGDTLRASSSSPSIKPIPLPEATVQICVGGPHSSSQELAASIPLPESRPASPIYSPEPSSPIQSALPSPQKARSIGHDSPSPPRFDHVPLRARSPSSDLTSPSSPMQSPTVSNGPTSHFGKSAPSKKSRTKPVPLSLTYLLGQADDLLATYPPSHPLLRVTDIMGPDSVMRTWRPLPLSAITRDAKTKVSRAQSKSLLDPRRIGLRLGALTPAERRVLFIGALLVVGAAMALKSSKLPCVDGLVKASGGDGLKRLWNDKWTLASSVVAAWGRGLP
ncbi:hypothetical protein J3R82DRAFT_7189 [Butyriboletus roseoflavus]|nr:hypothetical protein J3R82DRAFT_7189 [Butyriboletus roseoflavus]